MALYHTAQGSSPIEVKSHQIKGQVGYTVGGSPTIVDGVASGFGGGNYLYCTQKFSPNNNNWEVVVKIIMPEESSAGSHYIIGNMYAYDYSFVLGLPTSRKLRFWASSNGTSWDIVSGLDHNTVLELGATYYVRCGFTGTQYYVDLSTDGVNFFGRVTVNSSVKIHDSANYLSIGRAYGTSYPWFGSIDLNETYIKIDGQLWFYQPRPTQYVVKDGYLVWANPNIYLTGDNNYTVVGDLPITDGIASGFKEGNASNAKYLLLPETFPMAANSHIHFEFTPTQANFGSLLGRTGSNRNSIRLMASYGNRIALEVFQGSTALIQQSFTYSSALVLNNRHSLDLLYDGSTYTLIMKDIDANVEKINETYDYTIPSDIGNCGFTIGATKSDIWYVQLNASVNLNNSYISANNQLWWYGKNYATQNIAPVPSGFTYGTTTTSAIGYVDMRTQSFTAAPDGTEIGHD